MMILLVCGTVVAEEVQYSIDLESRVAYLLDRLEENHNKKLYYSQKLFTPPMWALIKVRGIGQHIINNAGRHAGKTYRFSVVTSLVHRILLCDYNESERDIIGKYLVRQFKDAEAWIRTESVWGIRIIEYIVDPDVVRPLLNDSDPHTAKEALDTIEYLKESFAGQL